MENVLLVAYLLIVVALIGVILVQRSEGGGLGMGGNAGGLMTVRGSANLLTRTTAILAALFFATAIGLTVLSELDRRTDSILDQAATPGEAAPSTILDALSQIQDRQVSGAPATPAPASTDPGLALPQNLGLPASSQAAPAAPASEAASSAAPAAEPSASGPTVLDQLSQLQGSASGQ
ncbi:MAG: preprotein translocase subunit SecG [Devosia sp.]